MHRSLRWMMTAPLLGLALLGCKREPPASDGEDASGSKRDCDHAALAELADELVAAGPDARVGLVASGLLESCAKPLPKTISAGLREVQGLDSDRTERLSLAEDPDFTRAKRLACPRLAELGVELGDSVGEQRYAKIYDICDYARFGVVPREEFVTLGVSGVLAWTTHALLLEQAVPEPTARSITRALFLLEQVHSAPILIDRRPTQRFARVPTRNRLPSGWVLSATATELVFVDRIVASLDAGALRPADVSNHRIVPLFELLDEELTKHRAVLGAGPDDQEPVDFPLVLAFDLRVPFATVVDSLYTAGRVGFTSYAFVVEPQFPVLRAIHISPPKYYSLDYVPPNLKVFITDDGFRVRLPRGDELELPKRDPEASTPDAWDHKRLRELAEDVAERYRGSPEPIQAVVSTENHMPLEILLATYATLAGPGCDQVRRTDCLLPDLFIEAGAG